MTCIVGVEHDGVVYMGGDSAAIGSQGAIQVCDGPKVFRNGPFVMGYTASFRMGQIMQHVFVPPAHADGKGDVEYLIGDVAPAIRSTLKAGSYDDGPALLLGYRGRLYAVLSDYQVSRPSCGYTAIGCGEDFALGSMYSTKDLPPKKRIKLALQAATFHHSGVRGPYRVL